MKITEERELKRELIALVREIDTKAGHLIKKVRGQAQKIAEIEEAYAALQTKHQAILEQIDEYIKELEQIRDYYANNNRKRKRKEV